MLLKLLRILAIALASYLLLRALLSKQARARLHGQISLIAWCLLATSLLLLIAQGMGIFHSF